MNLGPDELFTKLFQQLNRRSQQEFVAELYAARGWDTRFEDDHIVATRGGQTRQIAIVQPSRCRTPSLPNVDVVVLAGETDAIGVDFKGATGAVHTSTDLRDLLLYGLNREKATDLWETYFDQPFSAIESGSGMDEGRTSLVSRLWQPELTTRQSGVIVAVFLIVGLWVMGAGFFSETDPPNLAPESNNTYTPGSVGALGGERTYPPGLGPDGVEDAESVAKGHYSYLANKSYAYRVSASGPQHAPFMLGVTSWNASVRVENRTNYQYQRSAVAPYGFRVEHRSYPDGVNVTVWNPIRNPDSYNQTEREVLTKQVYANGTDKFWRYDHSNETVYQHLSKAQINTTRERALFQFNDRVALVGHFLTRFLTTENSSIRCLQTSETNDCLTYRVIATGEPALRGDVADYRAVAVVESSGLVRSLSVRYTIAGLDNPEKREQVRIQLEIVSVGNETISLNRPEWLDTAKNRTQNRDTETTNETS